MDVPRLASQLEASARLLGGGGHGTAVFEGRTVHLKATAMSRGPGEAQRLAWLAGRVGAPSLLAGGVVDGTFVVVTEELAATPVDSTLNVLAGEVSLRRGGEVLAALHSLDPRGCPYLCDREVVLARAARRVASGQVDTETFPAGLARYRPERLLELAAASITEECKETPVVCHGRASLDHLLLGPGCVGLAGLGALGLGDRYLDLARLLGEVADRFGAEAIQPVLEGYGLAKVDGPRLDGYALLAMLL